MGVPKFMLRGIRTFGPPDPKVVAYCKKHHVTQIRYEGGTGDGSDVDVILVKQYSTEKGRDIALAYYIRMGVQCTCPPPVKEGDSIGYELELHDWKGWK